MQRSNREKILDAVADSVHAVGVGHTTMAEVARRVDLSRSITYTHFSDTWEATAALLTRELLSLLPAATDDGESPEVAVRDSRHQLVDRAVLFARVVPHDPLVELNAELLGPHLVHHLGATQRAILDAVTYLVAAGQDDGSIPGGDPEQVAFPVFLVARSLVISARISEAEHGREKVLVELEHVQHRSLAP